MFSVSVIRKSNQIKFLNNPLKLITIHDRALKQKRNYER
jgi:hypothetical protein